MRTVMRIALCMAAAVVVLWLCIISAALCILLGAPAWAVQALAVVGTIILAGQMVGLALLLVVIIRSQR